MSNSKFQIESRAIFSVALAVVLFAVPVPSPGQQPAKVYRIGYLGTSTSGDETNPPAVRHTGPPLVAGIRGELAGAGVCPEPEPCHRVIGDAAKYSKVWPTPDYMALRRRNWPVIR